MDTPQPNDDDSQPSLMAHGHHDDIRREHRFWMGLLYAGLAAYAAVLLGTFGYTFLTWSHPNRGWFAGLLVGATFSTAIFYIFRQQIVATRWRLALFSTWNIVSYLFIILLCAVDGGIASPLTSVYILPILFLAIGYPLRVVLVCGVAGITGFALLAGLSQGPRPEFVVYMQLIALAVGFMLAILAAINRDRQSCSMLELQHQLEHMANTDALTGCLNQRAFNTTLTDEVERAARHQRMLALLMIDVDNFKSVNDEHGHLIGDELLRAVGAVLRAATRATDIPGRIGGDELALLAPETDHAAAMALADRLRQELRDYPLPVKMTLSIGVYATIPETEQAAALLRRADKALYEAKRGGRDQVVGYDDAAANLYDKSNKNII